MNRHLKWVMYEVDEKEREWEKMVSQLRGTHSIENERVKVRHLMEIWESVKVRDLGTVWSLLRWAKGWEE